MDEPPPRAPLPPAPKSLRSHSFTPIHDHQASTLTAAPGRSREPSTTDSCHVYAAAGDPPPRKDSAIHSTTFGWRQFVNSIESRLTEPPADFGGRVVRLVSRAVPVEGVAEPEFPVRVGADVDDFAERL